MESRTNAKPHALEIESELAILGTRLNQAQETRQWTRIAALLMDNEFWQAVEDLHRRGVIDKQQLQFLGEFPVSVHQAADLQQEALQREPITENY